MAQKVLTCNQLLLKEVNMISHIKDSPGTIAFVVGMLALTAVGAAPASANMVTFGFGSLANNATNAQIQSLMNSLLPAGDAVTVTGAVGSNSYSGDGHVTGPGNGNSSYTLANLDSAGHGTFIQNDTGHSSNDILMSFSGLTISSVSFDFEIFPDGSCTSLSGNNCGGRGNPNLPDLTLMANGSPVEGWNALVPGSSGNSHGVSASPYVHSPASGHSNNELAPQLLGSSGVVTLPANTTVLDFQDWPATIAINNLVINFTPDPPAVPEPATASLVGSGLLGLLLFGRRRKEA
jgi:PEP-CTERM motif